MKKILPSVSLANALFLLAAPSFGQNIGFLDYDPTRYFTDEDWKISDRAYLNALENAADGETITWRNEASGAHGTETPLRTYTSKRGNKCRQMRSTLDTTNPVASGQFTFVWCKQPDGQWKLAKKKLKKKALK